MRPIVILTSHNSLNHYLVAKLASHVPVGLVIYERHGFSEKWKLLKGRLRKLGFAKTLLQVLFVLFHMCILYPSSSLKVQKLIGGVHGELPSLPSKEVESVNSKEIADLLLREQPGVVVVSGTGILKKELLSLPFLFLNIHTGITPQYRGVYGGFWALFQKDFENIGVTVHAVDRGVDTGNVVYQDVLVLDPAFDTFDTIAAKQYIRGTDLMIRAIHEAVQGRLQSFRKEGESRQWYHPTLLQYMKGMRILKREYPKHSQ